MTLCEMYLQLPKTMSLHSQEFEPRPVLVGCVVDKMALEQSSLKVLLFPWSLSFHHCSILIHSSIADPVTWVIKEHTSASQLVQ